jgi:hypothetical protein
VHRYTRAIDADCAPGEAAASASAATGINSFKPRLRAIQA